MISKNHVLEVDVYVGNGGDVVIMQEWPGLKGERYLRVFIHPDEAEDVCRRIMAAADEARRK